MRVPRYTSARFQHHGRQPLPVSGNVAPNYSAFSDSDQRTGVVIVAVAEDEALLSLHELLLRQGDDVLWRRRRKNIAR